KAEQGRFYRWSEKIFEKVISNYDITLRWVLKHQFPTLLITIATLVLTILLYIFIPKGFFPVQDTGQILGISQAPADVSFPSMSVRQQALGKVILQDPDVSNLSSFIGVDGINTTGNSGRIQINLKPRSDRSATASQIIQRLQPQLAEVEGITLYMQPVQDLTVESQVSRTQYQYTLEDADVNELNAFAPKLVEKLKGQPELRDVASNQQTGGLQAAISIDRDTAARLGITPQQIDDALYDAFGQR